MDASHRWIHGGRRAERARILATLDLPPLLMPTVDAHQRLRGPYTAAGEIARTLTPGVLERLPELVQRYDIELLSTAPDLSAIVPNSRETLTSMALPAERTRYYALLRTTRIANGLVEFIRDGIEQTGPRTLVIEQADHAEQTDIEFLTAAVRRIDPARLTIVVCTGDEPDPQLTTALATHAVSIAVDPAEAPARPGDAQACIDADGTTDEPALITAYEALEPAVRAELHDRRAAHLTATEPAGATLGAIPYHLEHGSDRATAIRAIYAAEDHAVVNGFYEAVAGYARRGLALVGDETDSPWWWLFTTHLGMALSIQGRTHEALAVYNDARLRSIDPTVHMMSAYSTAMLYTRHNIPQERDEKLAKAWLNGAIATASLVADPSERAFQSAFYRNGLALVEVNLGDPAEALRLVDWCIDSLDRLLTPEEHQLHRSVLKNNRARVYAGLGRLDDALADYAIVIRDDPNHAEHYLERGNIMRRLGRSDEAFADYDRALRLSPPFPEIYYNRGDLRMSQGDTAGALDDFSYVIDLNPEFTDAYVNRAGIYLDGGETDLAYADAVVGLEIEPDNAYLLVVLGQVLAERGEYAGAGSAYDRALAASPDLLTALSGRATLAFEMGEFDAAIDDLRRAVDLDPTDPLLRYNRAFVHQGRGRWDDALIDLDIAATLAPDDPEISDALATCRERLAEATR